MNRVEVTQLTCIISPLIVTVEVAITISNTVSINRQRKPGVDCNTKSRLVPSLKYRFWSHSNKHVIRFILHTCTQP